MSVVVDASVVVALVVADERQGAVQALFEGWVDSGEDLHAPAVLPYEVANVVARIALDGQLRTDEVSATWADLAALGIDLHLFDLATTGLQSQRSRRDCGAATPPTPPTSSSHNS